MDMDKAREHKPAGQHNDELDHYLKILDELKYIRTAIFVVIGFLIGHGLGRLIDAIMR